MNSYLLNELPKQIENGIITKKDAVNKISIFICNNYKVFNLQKFDEDFRSEIVMYFLEHGEHILDNFKPELGDLFTYLYTYISSLTYTKRRTLAKKRITEIFAISECQNLYSEKEYNYSKLKPAELQETKVPYAINKISQNELKKIFEKIRNDNTDKRILVLALKSSFYITDTQIQKVCKIYNLRADDFYKTIQYFKDSLVDKVDKRQKELERRNTAYYHHRKYLNQISKLEEDNDYHDDLLFLKLINKEQKHSKNWIRINNKFIKGYLYLRPSAKAIADILGICERQVNYYVNSAKNEFENHDF